MRLFQTKRTIRVGRRRKKPLIDLRIRILLMQESRHTTHSLETWVANRASAIFNLAEMAASRPPEQMQSYLALTVNSDVNFQRAGLLDREATTTAYFPLLDEHGHKNIGISFADRPYIPVLKLLSDSILGFRSFSVEFSAKESMSSKPRFPFQPPEPDIVIEPGSYDDV